MRAIVGSILLTTLIVGPVVAGPSLSPEQKLAAALAGRVQGAAVSCIRQRDIDTVRVFDGTALLYQMRGGDYYLNRPSSGAETLRSDSVLITDTHSDQLCDVDIVRLVDRSSGIQSGFVDLDKFVPYVRPR